MIIVKNAELPNILKIIGIERSYLESLKDNVEMIKASDPAVLKDIDTYISKNAVFNGISEAVRREISSKHTLFDAITFALDNAIELSKYVETKLKASKQKLFDTSTISYREKGMFDWLNTISFFSNYTSKIIDVVLTQPKTINNYLSKADFEYLNKTVMYYRTVLKRLTDSRKNLIRSIEMLSDEQYDPEFSSIIEKAKGKDATTIGLAPHNFSPEYWRRYLVMRWDVSTLQSNQEKIEMYSAKLQRLEIQRAGGANPKLDSQIEYWENQIQILDSDIADIEAKYA